MLYQYLKKMQSVCEAIGAIETVEMGGWVTDRDLIVISGTTDKGHPYKMTLAIDKEEQNAD